MERANLGVSLAGALYMVQQHRRAGGPGLVFMVAFRRND